MSHASLEVLVLPVLLYNTNSFTHHVGIVRANLINILVPKFNQVPLDHIYDINHVLHMLQGINSLQELFASRRDTHHIWKGMVV
jgi:hypothetical protein